VQRFPGGDKLVAVAVAVLLELLEFGNLALDLLLKLLRPRACLADRVLEATAEDGDVVVLLRVVAGVVGRARSRFERRDAREELRSGRLVLGLGLVETVGDACETCLRLLALLVELGELARVLRDDALRKGRSA
jgi:hypothetical protein